MSPITSRLAAGICTALLSATLFATAAAATPFAPVDRPGPRLTVNPRLLAASIKCTGDLRKSGVEPVLLVPATTVDSEQNFGWNYEPVLAAHGIPYCTSDLPGDDAYNMDDIQNRADYLVYSIRTMYARAGDRKIAMIGASQGGEASRWPLRFWPDTRPMVSDVIALDSPNHGSTSVNTICSIPCAPALWQQTYNSHYMQALNSYQETFAGISYTNIATTTDDFVEPNSPGNSTVFLTGPSQITNAFIQDICPGTIAEHLSVATTNPIAVDLALDAITHPGTANTARIDRSACTAGPFAQGVPAAESASRFATASAQVTRELATAPTVNTEPPLRCYVYASCPITSTSRDPATPAIAATPARKECLSRRTILIHLAHSPRIRSARVTIAGHAVPTRLAGRRGVRVSLRSLPKGAFTVHIIAHTRRGIRTTTRRYRTCIPRMLRQRGRGAQSGS